VQFTLNYWWESTGWCFKCNSTGHIAVYVQRMSVQ